MNKNTLKYPRFTIALILLSFIIPVYTFGQDTATTLNDTTFVQKEIGDIIREALHKPPKIKEESAGSLILLPIIGSNPATGFMFGVGGQYAFKMARKLYVFCPDGKCPDNYKISASFPS